MTGPGLALLIIPIVATAGLVVWLIMVFSADGHPRQLAATQPASRRASPATTAERVPTPAVTASRPREAVASGAPASSSAPRRDPRLRQPPAR